ncbi:hypothetical protein FJ872_31610 [Mesorhizobium sp. B2-5-9]|uniref:hypothetical protein n=1 Tax=Mesorhizobium sp. B2-5-9 TaxID=2589921 RepID=UPI00112E7407|nr:hypothetical protein [Mesorhizobium sp. B2-5-9]TPJ98283.1 hypothetical protein FJ872_31610 [Mesorhizobium sp. B2-5-9]
MPALLDIASKEGASEQSSERRKKQFVQVPRMRVRGALGALRPGSRSRRAKSINRCSVKSKPLPALDKAGKIDLGIIPLPVGAYLPLMVATRAFCIVIRQHTSNDAKVF